jgi:hypothetical protein
MILIQTDSSLLKTALDAENSFLYWMKHDTTTIDNTQYSAIQAKFSAWQDAYEENDLYITTGSGTQQVEGIDRVPVINPR